MYLNEKQPTFKYVIEGWLFFLAQKFVLSIIIRIFAVSVPTKPLNDAQMRGAFLYIRFFSKYANGKIHLSGYRV